MSLSPTESSTMPKGSDDHSLLIIGVPIFIALGGGGIYLFGSTMNDEATRMGLPRTKLGRQAAGAALVVSSGTEAAIAGELKKAHGAFTAANEKLAKNSNDADALCDRGYAYFTAGQFNEALADYNRAIELRPKDRGTYRLRAELYEMMNGGAEQAKKDRAKIKELGG